MGRVGGEPRGLNPPAPGLSYARSWRWSPAFCLPSEGLVPPACLAGNKLGCSGTPVPWARTGLGRLRCNERLRSTDGSLQVSPGQRLPSELGPRLPSPGSPAAEDGHAAACSGRQPDPGRRDGCPCFPGVRCPTGRGTFPAWSLPPTLTKAGGGERWSPGPPSAAAAPPRALP